MKPLETDEQPLQEVAPPFQKELPKGNFRRTLRRFGRKLHTPTPNQKREGRGKYNYGPAGEEAKVYYDEQGGQIYMDEVEHDASLFDSLKNIKSVEVREGEEEVGEEEWEEGEEGEEGWEEAEEE